MKKVPYCCDRLRRYSPSVFGQERTYLAAQVANAPLVPDWVSSEGDSGVDDPPGLLQYPGDGTFLAFWDLRLFHMEGCE